MSIMLFDLLSTASKKLIKTKLKWKKKSKITENNESDVHFEFLVRFMLDKELLRMHVFNMANDKWDAESLAYTHWRKGKQLLR